MDDRFTELKRMHGCEGARLTAENHGAAIDAIERIAREEGIACEFERLDGYLLLASGQSPDLLEKELQAAHCAGLTSMAFAPRAPLTDFDTSRCLVFPRQGQFHPLKYLAGLARAVERRGGRIVTGAHVTRIEGGQPARVTIQAGPVVTGDAVVATNTPINDRVAMHTKQAPYRTYVIGLWVPDGSVVRALYWDTLDPYHYVRLQRVEEPYGPGHDLLIVGGEDHKTGQEEPAGRFDKLEQWTCERFPKAGPVEFRWSGQVLEPIDGLEFIGRNPMDADNVYIATGDSGQGMTHGTIAGLLISDLIQERANPWVTLYDPSRRTLRAAGKFARENLNVAAQYADYLSGGEIRSADQVPPGHGAEMRCGVTEFVAIYRDPNGVVHRRSAICPHLGSVVHWNATERSWDCPCHGSRFDPLGRVLNGPAPVGLKPVEDKQPART